jgi:hypothetical protein
VPTDCCIHWLPVTLILLGDKSACISPLVIIFVKTPCSEKLEACILCFFNGVCYEWIASILPPGGSQLRLLVD